MQKQGRNEVEAGRDDPSRPLRGHPPLKGEGELAPTAPILSVNNIEVIYDHVILC